VARPLRCANPVTKHSKHHSTSSIRGRRGAVRIGFIALADCAPLLAADALGLFAKHDVQVELHREVGWATIREKILYRQIDAAHAVTGLGLSLRLGLGGAACRTIAPFIFNLHGNAITLSMDLWRRGVRDAASLGKLIRSNPQRLITLGIVARTSTHNFMMRRWLLSGGINPDRDVRLVVLPPTQMVGSLAAGLIDGYCVGEPWNSAAVSRGIGWCPVTSEDLMPGHPEKVLLTTEDYAEEHPAEIRAVIRALYEACQFCDRMDNRARVVEILLNSGHVRADREVLKLSLIGPFDDGTSRRRAAQNFHIFHRGDANAPSRAKAEWLLGEFIAHGFIPAEARDHAREEALRCCTPELFHDALSTPAPATKPTKSKAKADLQPALA
jgi:ABC-type nitrate/sulfonate/bicarbonate transport system substrate-binding protein